MSGQVAWGRTAAAALGRCLLAATLAGLCCAARADATPGAGKGSAGHAVCIAPISLDRNYYVGPAEQYIRPDDRFTLDFGGYRQVMVKVREAQWVRGLPPDGKFMLNIRRNGKPHSAFRLDMRTYGDKDICLVFNGYGVWQVIDHNWSWKAFGCKCP